jgi:hypothetical protein
MLSQAQRAFELWVHRGGRHGEDWADWFDAEAHLRPPHPWGATWFPAADWFTTGLAMQCDALAELHERVVEGGKDQEAALTAQFEKLKSALQPHDEQVDAVIDDLMSVQTQVRWSALLHCVALYHYLESEIVVLFRWRLSAFPEKERAVQLRRVHRWDELKKLSRGYVDTRLSEVAEYATVNELRNVCNSVKHTGGAISKDLADLKGKGWTEGEDIDHARLDLKMFSSGAQAFLDDLLARAERGTTRLLGLPRP